MAGGLHPVAAPSRSDGKNRVWACNPTSLDHDLAIVAGGRLSSFATPREYVPYGGLIASLIDCHSTGTAAAAMYRSEARGMGSLPPFRFVTGSLQVSYLKPTPIDGELVIRGKIKEIKGRKVIVETTALVDGVATTRGTVVAVQMPEDFGLDKPQVADKPSA